MLEELRIKNLAVVEDVVLTFGPGLNVLTGSTGAGKSLILSAVNLLLGGRGSARAIRAGEPRASVEGVFRVASPIDDKLLATLDGERHLTLKRDIDSKGRSRASINGRSCSLKQLQEVSAQLIEPHGQNEQLQLKNAESHVTYLDKFAGNDGLRAAWAESLDHFQAADRAAKEFERRLAEAKDKRELLEHRLDEINRASLRSGEREELEKSIQVLTHGQDIFDVLSAGGQSLYDDESSAASQIAQIRKRLLRFKEFDPVLGGFADALEKAEIQLSETAADMRAYADGLEFDPGRLAEMQERLDYLLGLERRYQMPVDQLKAQADTWTAELESLVFEAEERAKLARAKAAAAKRLCEAGKRLSRSRRDAANVLDKQMTAEIEALMLVGATFRTDFRYESDEQSELHIDGEAIRARDDGFDDVVFYVRTNPGEAEGNVADVASSGELSRIALALKSVVSIGREGSVLIFDELDAGVGADMGAVVAAKLATLSKSYQIVCITHMPQIAACGSNHLVVRKVTSGGRTSTEVQPATGDERIGEIARMLGGQTGSEKRVALAKEMLRSSVAPATRLENTGSQSSKRLKS